MITATLLPSLILASVGLTTPHAAPWIQADPGPGAQGIELDEAVAEAKRALEAGDFERAHALVGALLFQQRVAGALALEAAGDDRGALAGLRRAFALGLRPPPPGAEVARARIEARVLAALLERAAPAVLAGDPRTALPLLDEALAIAPRDPRTNHLRARAALELGEEIGEVFLFQDALESAELALSSEPAARYYGARAARLLHYADGDPAPLERSILLSRALLDDLRTGRVRRDALPADPAPEQVHAEALFDRYRLALQQEDAARAGSLYDPAKQALQTWLGATPDDPAAWRQLSSLFEWSGELEEAQTVLTRALNLLPEELSIHENLARVSRSIGGPEETVRLYGVLVERMGSSPLAHWFLAQDQLEAALDKLSEREAQVADFERAAGSFARTRALAEEYAEACLGREALCRAGAGWVHYWEGDLEAAEAAFRSMEDGLPGGLEWQYPGRLLSGIDSLNFLVEQWYQRSLDEDLPGAERDEALVRAAGIARSISEHRPTDSSLANNAGFLSRDASEALERRGSALVERALGATPAGSPEEGMALIGRARELMEASYAAYVRASELAPDDARVINDTGLILTYYLRRAPETARAYHERAIAVGAPRLEAGDLAEDDDLFTAVGDAYQNLGYLELCWLGDARAALPFLERSMDYAPQTRSDVPAWLIPLTRRVLEGRLDAATVVTAHLFAPSDPERVLERAVARRAMRAAFAD